MQVREKFEESSSSTLLLPGAEVIMKPDDSTINKIFREFITKQRIK